MFGDFTLPQRLVDRALTEHARDGMIHSDTAALLIEAGAHPAELEAQVFTQGATENV